ncbi:MAG: amidohydrolase [Clostridia bacterium]|nr:amidohydrolase [Clostridia bacterium]
MRPCTLPSCDFVMKFLFFHAKILLTDTAGFHVLDNAYLGVDGKTICYIGDVEPQETYDVRKDMAGKLLLPGFYNCHTHSPMTLLRGLGSGLPLQRWLNEAVFPMEAKLQADDIEAGCDLALMEMLACGTVGFSDMYFYPETIAEAALNAGIKANIARHVLSFDPGEDPAKNESLLESLRLYDAWHGAGDGRIAVDFSIHAEYTCTPKVVSYYAEKCRERNGNLHIHLSETKAEHEACKQKYGMTPAAWFASLGAFDADAFAAHCVWLEDADIGILKEKNVSAVHNPSSNMKLGSGFAPLSKMLKCGLNVAIGTDGAASNNNLNLPEEMHLAAVIHNGYLLEATALQAGDVLKMATVNGAKLQRRRNCGSLAVGNAADIVAVDLNAPHLQPCLDVPALLVYSMQASDVKMTMVDGRILYENGEYKTLDAEKIRFAVLQSTARLYE